MTRKQFIKGKNLWVKFQGMEFYLPKDSGQEHSPLATEEQYRDGLCSFAHVYANYEEGNISRFGKNIGCLKDLVMLKPQKPPVKPDYSVCIANTLAWGRRVLQ